MFSFLFSFVFLSNLHLFLATICFLSILFGALSFLLLNQSYFNIAHLIITQVRLSTTLNFTLDYTILILYHVQFYHIRYLKAKFDSLNIVHKYLEIILDQIFVTVDWCWFVLVILLNLIFHCRWWSWVGLMGFVL